MATDAPTRGVAYLRALLAADDEGVRVLHDSGPPAELVAELAGVALALAQLALGNPVQVDLWLAAYLRCARVEAGVVP